MARLALTAKMGAIWIQPSGANNPTYFLDCKDMGDLAISEGAETLLQCFKADGSGWETVGSTVAPPDPVGFDITGLLFESLDWLERVECPFTIYVLQRQCGRADVFQNYVRGFVVSNVSRQSRTYANLVARDTDAESTLAAALQAYPPVLQVEELTVERKTTVSTDALYDVAFNVDARCLGGGCGDEMDQGERGMIAGNSAVGPAVASVLQTVNDGDTWTQIVAAAPLAAGEPANSIVRFDYGRDGERYLWGTAPAAGQGQVGYTDDNGATVTLVSVGGAAAGHGPLFWGGIHALDERHIWIAGGGGYIYFSEDGGETWAVQDAGVASGAADLWYVNFDETGVYGVATGAADLIVLTSDGGSSWAVAGGTTGSGDDLLCCARLDEERLWVGTDESGLWYSRDGGTTWTQRTGWPQSGLASGHVQDMAWVGDQVCFMSYQDAAPLGHIHYTFDGGYTWERLTTPTNSGLNGIFAVHERLAWCVGELQGGTGMILEIHG